MESSVLNLMSPLSSCPWTAHIYNDNLVLEAGILNMAYMFRSIMCSCGQKNTRGHRSSVSYCCFLTVHFIIIYTIALSSHPALLEGLNKWWPSNEHSNHIELQYPVYTLHEIFLGVSLHELCDFFSIISFVVRDRAFCYTELLLMAIRK